MSVVPALRVLAGMVLLLMPAGLAIVVRGWGDETAWATVVAFSPRWLVLVGWLAAGLLLWPQRKGSNRGVATGAVGLSLGLAMSLGFALGPWMGLRVSAQGMRSALMGDALTTVQPELTLMTLNLNGEAADEAKLVRLVEQWDPDLLFFQECPTARLMEEGIPDAILMGRRILATQALCFATRLPIVQSASKHTSGAAAGAVGFYRVLWEDQIIDLFNVHLPTPRPGLEGILKQRPDAWTHLEEVVRARRHASAELRVWMDGYSATGIVAGDWNMTADSRLFREDWLSGRNDAFAEAGLGFGWTKKTRILRARIDHVLVGQPWEVQEIRILSDIGSDHLPQYVRLRRRLE